jgi:hypothetical protein
MSKYVLEDLFENMKLLDCDSIRLGIHQMKWDYENKDWIVLEDSEYSNGQYVLEHFKNPHDALNFLLNPMK